MHLVLINQVHPNTFLSPILPRTPQFRLFIVNPVASPWKTDKCQEEYLRVPQPEALHFPALLNFALYTWKATGAPSSSLFLSPSRARYD